MRRSKAWRELVGRTNNRRCARNTTIGTTPVPVADHVSFFPHLMVASAMFPLASWRRWPYDDRNATIASVEQPAAVIYVVAWRRRRGKVAVGAW